MAIAMLPVAGNQVSLAKNQKISNTTCRDLILVCWKYNKWKLISSEKYQKNFDETCGNETFEKLKKKNCKIGIWYIMWFRQSDLCLQMNERERER